MHIMNQKSQHVKNHLTFHAIIAARTPIGNATSRKDFTQDRKHVDFDRSMQVRIKVSAKKYGEFT